MIDCQVLSRKSARDHVKNDYKYEKPVILADYTDRWTRGIDLFAKKILFNPRYVDGIGLIAEDLNFPRAEEELRENLSCCQCKRRRGFEDAGTSNRFLAHAL